MYSLINSISFTHKLKSFQRTLKKDICLIRKSKKIIIFSDKTNNLYKIDPINYHKLLINNVTKDYALCNSKIVDDINNEAQGIITTEGIKGKIPKLDNSKAFITIKDHKDDFPNTLKCRLINPSKSHIGKISKGILDHINMRVREHAGLVQWKNTAEALAWFNNIENKPGKCFVSFDIVEFYPSITKAHLLSALSFAKNFLDITDNDMHIIMHSCKSLLFNDNNVWRKKCSTELFDVTMGSFHGAEVCDLVGLFILSKLSPIISNCGLYRDDGLAVIDTTSRFNYERLRKSIFKTVKDIGFRITLQIGHVRTNFLDVSLDLFRDSYMPYRKPNSTTTYIDSKSNHPKHVKSSLPLMIGKRLAALSKNESAYNESIPSYKQSLQKSGFPFNLSYNDCVVNPSTPTNEARPKRNNRKRQFLFYNPPFCNSVTTNLGKEFLKLVDKHFPRNHIYHPILNRKTIKISYSCMPSMKSIIKCHNDKILDNFYAERRNSITQRKHTRVNNPRISNNLPPNDPHAINILNVNPSTHPKPTCPYQDDPLIDHIPSRSNAPSAPTIETNEPHCSYVTPQLNHPPMPQEATNCTHVSATHTTTQAEDHVARNKLVDTTRGPGKFTKPLVHSPNNNCDNDPQTQSFLPAMPTVHKQMPTPHDVNANSPHHLPPNTINPAIGSPRQHCKSPLGLLPQHVINPCNSPAPLRRSTRNTRNRRLTKDHAQPTNNTSTNPVCTIDPLTPTCNCRKKATCPLGGNCTIRNVIYRVDTLCNNESKVYIGSTGNRFKDRYNQHMHDFKKPHLRTATRLSEYVWSCISRFGKRPEMRWSIIHAMKSIPSGARKICTTCNMEKIAIASADKTTLLNRRNEMSALCPHFRRFYFS